MAPIQRASCSYELKLEVIQKVNAGVKRSQVMKEYGFTSRTLSRWLSASDKIVAKVKSGSGKIKKATPTLYPNTDAAMTKWFTENRSNDVPIDSHMFHVKALEFCQRLGKLDLAVSDGFISRWKKRHNVVHRSVCGEANSVDLSKVDQFRNETILFTHGKLLHLV